MQKKVQMAKSVVDWNGLRYRFLKYGPAEQISKLILSAYLSTSFPGVTLGRHIWLQRSFGFVI